MPSQQIHNLPVPIAPSFLSSLSLFWQASGKCDCLPLATYSAEDWAVIEQIRLAILPPPLEKQVIKAGKNHCTFPKQRNTGKGDGTSEGDAVYFVKVSGMRTLQRKQGQKSLWVGESHLLMRKVLLRNRKGISGKACLRQARYKQPLLIKLIMINS